MIIQVQQIQVCTISREQGQSYDGAELDLVIE